MKTASSPETSVGDIYHWTRRRSRETLVLKCHLNHVPVVNMNWVCW